MFDLNTCLINFTFNVITFPCVHTEVVVHKYRELYQSSRDQATQTTSLAKLPNIYDYRWRKPSVPVTWNPVPLQTQNLL